MNMQQMMRQAQKMQKELAKAQEEVATMTAEGTAGGMVSAVVRGDMTVESVTIDPEAVDPEDVEMLQDMVCAAVNEAIRNINEESNARLSAVSGGMGLPGMGGGMPGIPGLR